MTEPSVQTGVARLCFPRGVPGAVITNGGAESTLLGMVLARKDAADAPVQVVCARNALPRLSDAVDQLELPPPVVLDSMTQLAEALAEIRTATVVIASAGTADTGSIDPLRDIGLVCRRRGSWLHVDASAGGAALFSDRLRPLLNGLDLADSVTVELPELGASTGLLAVRDVGSLTGVRMMGHPEVAAVYRACRANIGPAAERRCDMASAVAEAVLARPSLRLWERPVLATVVFRPTGATDEMVADLAGKGRELTTVDGQVWLRITVTDRPLREYLELLAVDHVRVLGTTPND
ncbi:pyridoxal-dependent decarboxylase [Kibdelosporangium philippinense]|uniref:Pyridoxal-dependent decarboxylase n=1 Tax=Kibdelosporangium philippinense TaxID=211113 RepID=A0ABS8ZPU7_9PSEU|nr:pyridoxal-dependent decarboxylase [Kibdelosporangium philippinense]MCE7009773.1 pyridoxal-dependent decarboxylase [Kibdelosporangium philippinense]